MRSHFVFLNMCLIVEKEQKYSPNDLESITMWADLSSQVADARSSERPLQTPVRSTDKSVCCKIQDNDGIINKFNYRHN